MRRIIENSINNTNIIPQTTFGGLWDLNRKMKIITPIEDIILHNKKSLFLAGGITNCPNWQKEFIDILPIDLDIVVYNPRRDNFPINDPNASLEQIKWEYDRLKESDMIMFWFSRGSLNPIVLYELGMWGNSRQKTKIFIGCDLMYERIQDVKIQTMLARNDIVIHSDLLSIKDQIVRYLSE